MILSRVSKRPALRWFGGKWILADWILSHFPEHRCYVEPYGGAASVLIKKKRSYAEVWNDLDDSVYSFFTCLSDSKESKELKRLLEITPYSRREFELAHVSHPDRVEKARRLVIRSFMGFGADSASNLHSRTGFRSNSNRSGSTPAHDWVNYPESIPLLSDRFKGVVLENKDAKEVMLSHDSSKTLHYVDPPYTIDTRRKNRYRHEMTLEDHDTLLTFLNTLKGAIVLSGYDNPTYERRLGWDFEKKTKKAFADGGKEREECLWIRSAK